MAHKTYKQLTCCLAYLIGIAITAEPVRANLIDGSNQQAQPPGQSSQAPNGQTPSQQQAQPPTPTQTATPTKPSQTQGQQPSNQDLLNAIQEAKKSNPDLALVLGIGSLIVDKDVTDYKVQSNVLQSGNIGRATPQFLTGLSFRSRLPNPYSFKQCKTSAEIEVDKSKADEKRKNAAEKARKNDAKDPQTNQRSETNDGNPIPVSAASAPQHANANSGSQLQAPNPSAATDESENGCQIWERRPWSFFVSVKFAPSASQVVNGYVFGFTYSIQRHLDVLVGLALTPINEPAPGFRVAASQFVANQQKMGQDLNFDPVAMLNNKLNAFDGFSIADSTGKLIYSGNPTTVHYHGGAVFGISIPISFKSMFSSQ
jgi:hypothetical protein